MSLASWKAEFYPVDANSKEALKHPARHSIRKWTGLSRDNLRKHGLRKVGQFIIQDGNGSVFEIDDDTCALCQHDVRHTKNHLCDSCPLYEVRGHVPCGRAMSDEEESPYRTFGRTGRVLPMLKWLRKALKLENSRQAK